MFNHVYSIDNKMGRKAKFDEKVQKKGSSQKGKNRKEPVFSEGLIGKYPLVIFYEALRSICICIC